MRQRKPPVGGAHLYDIYTHALATVPHTPLHFAHADPSASHAARCPFSSLHQLTGVIDTACHTYTHTHTHTHTHAHTPLNPIHDPVNTTRTYQYNTNINTPPMLPSHPHPAPRANQHTPSSNPRHIMARHAKAYADTRTRYDMAWHNPAQ